MLLEFCWTLVALLMLLPRRLQLAVLPAPDDDECRIDEKDLLCRHAPPHARNIEGYGPIDALIINDWQEDTLEAESVLRGFPHLRRFVINNGNLSSIITPFSASANSLEVVEITGTGLRQLTAGSFADLPALRVLDLRNNTLIRIDPADLIGIPTLRELYLSGNQWKCDESSAWFVNASFGSLVRRVVDRDELSCAPPFKNRPLLPVMEFVQITDLAPLKSNPVYKSVLDLYLDNNVIESVSTLDGSYWLEQFRLLSLRGNKLTDFPTYAFENVLPHNENAVSLFLDHNPWRCDCQFTPGFQELLIKHGNLVKDISDVRCAPTGNGEFANKQIRELSRSEICTPTNEDYWVYPLDVLNVLLASLIVLIIGKLFYDYWSFKRTGKLPWLVARMP